MSTEHLITQVRTESPMLRMTAKVSAVIPLADVPTSFSILFHLILSTPTFSKLCFMENESYELPQGWKSLEEGQGNLRNSLDWAFPLTWARLLWASDLLSLAHVKWWYLLRRLEGIKLADTCKEDPLTNTWHLASDRCACHYGCHFIKTNSGSSGGSNVHQLGEVFSK